MLGSANSEVSLRAAAIQARNTQLSVQLEGLGARMAGAEQQIKDRESALAAARVALVEKDSGFCRLEAQVAALEQQLLAAGHAVKKQEGNCGCVPGLRIDQASAVFARSCMQGRQ
jgi:chromosome segregation ATPase